MTALWMRDRFALKEWVCPRCHKFNLSRVSYDSGYLVQCKREDCQSLWVVGHTLRPYHQKGKRRAWPPDLVMRPEWCEGQPVNEILDAQVARNSEDEIGGSDGEEKQQQ